MAAHQRPVQLGTFGSDIKRAQLRVRPERNDKASPVAAFKGRALEPAVLARYNMERTDLF